MKWISVLVLCIYLTCFHALAYEEVFIQAVSNTKKSFVTRTGKRSGVFPGHLGTFLTPNVALVARAQTVTGEYTVWELENDMATVPFENGQIVTYQDAKEYAWTLMPIEQEIKLKRLYQKEPKWSGALLGGFSKGISESVSGVNSTAIGTTRNGGLVEAHWNYDVTTAFEMGIGLRSEREVISTDTADLTTTRNMLLANAIYLFPILTDFYNTQIYGGFTLGLGRSATTTSGYSQTGSARLLPATRLGLKLPVTDDYWFLAEGAIDNLTTVETLSDGSTQTTNQSVGRVMIGLKRYFNF